MAMKKIDLLIVRYRDYLAANDALQFVDDRIVTGAFEACSDRNKIHVQVEFLQELAVESGLEIEVTKRAFDRYVREFSICYEGVTIFALGDGYGAS